MDIWSKKHLAESSLCDDVTLLLTACVNPAGMCQTVLQDSDLRLAHYIQALNFYLENTNLRVVIVENTGVDLSNYVDDKWIQNKRLEVLHFYGNNFEKKKGKGYGEALIIEYAFKYSRMISNSKYVVKITGRYMILNIVKTISHYQTHILNGVSFVAIEDCYYRFKLCTSECIIAPICFYKDYFLPQIERIDDSQHFYFEHLLFEVIGKWMKINTIRVFRSALNINAVSGSTFVKVNRNAKHKMIHSFRRLLYISLFRYLHSTT